MRRGSEPIAGRVECALWDMQSLGRRYVRRGNVVRRLMHEGHDLRHGFGGHVATKAAAA